MNVKQTIDTDTRKALRFEDPVANAACTIDIDDTQRPFKRTINVETGKESACVMLQIQPTGLAIAIDYNESPVYEGRLSALASDRTPIQSEMLSKAEEKAAELGVSVGDYLARLIEADTL